MFNNERDLFIYLFWMMVLLGTTWAHLGYFMVTFRLPRALVFNNSAHQCSAIGMKVFFFSLLCEPQFPRFAPTSLTTRPQRCEQISCSESVVAKYAVSSWMMYIKYQITKQGQVGFILSNTSNLECIYCHIDAIIIGC